jgi:dipeptidyl aminopeptidase/acylaminoacyl peptidase
MRKMLILFGLALAGGPALAGDTHPFSVRDMLAMDRISDPRVSPDGKLVTFGVSVTDLAANRRRADLYLAEIGSGKTRRLTTHEAADSTARWSPDGKALYFLSTRSGSQQVWRLDLAGGEPEAVTDQPLDVDNLEVGPGGKFLVFSMAVFPGATPADSKARLDAKEKSKATGRLYDRLFVRHWDTWSDGTRNHWFVYPLPGGPARDLMPAMDADAPGKPFGGSEEMTVSPDGKTLVFSAKDVGREEAWSTNFDLFAVPSDGSAAPRKLTSNPAWDTQPRFSPDGKTLAYLAMSRAGYEADRFRIILRAWPGGVEKSHDLKADASPRGDRSPAEIAWTADGRELLATADHLGQHSLFAVDVATGATRMVVEKGTLSNPQPLLGGRVLFATHSLLGPTEIATAPLSGGLATAVTRLNADKVAAARFGKPEQFSFLGAKGDTVYGYLVYPVDFDPAQKYPVAFLIHGGPQGSFGNDFHYRWNPQAYAGAGYAAVMVDFHGSTGYGQAFTDAINGDWGGAPFEDLMKGLDFALLKYPFLDAVRTCALGGSYGGYMVNWIEGSTDRFRCLVSHDGNLDETMAYFDTEELWFPEWEHGGVPWEKPEGFSQQSPLARVKDWKTPMLVVHSAKDYRVVDTQGIATFTALQRKGIPSKLLYFPDENHWVLKPQNSILWHETVLGWLDQWLKGGGR